MGINVVYGGFIVIVAHRYCPEAIMDEEKLKVAGISSFPWVGLLMEFDGLCK